MARPIYRQSAQVRIVFCAVFLLLLTGLAPANAQANPAYTVEGVEVDVTAKNAVLAREKALDAAQMKAYRMLAERFLPPAELAAFKMPDPAAVSLLVQDFEVTNEQLSSRRYKGTYTIRFRPNAMRSAMAAQGRTYSDTPQRPVMVLPFYQSGTRTTLWGDGNPWIRAWRAAPSGDVMHPLVVPAGDAPDIARINDEVGINTDPAGVGTLARRYNAGEVAYLVASDAPAQGPAPAGLLVNLYTLGVDGPVFTEKKLIARNANEADDAFYARAVTEMKGRLRTLNANAAARAAPVQTVETTVYTNGAAYPTDRQIAGVVPYTKTALGPSQTYPVIARFSSVQEWVKMKGILDRTYGMQSVMIKTLKPKEASLDLRYAGDAPALQLALQNAGYMLRQNGGTMEIVRTAMR